MTTLGDRIKHAADQVGGLDRLADMIPDISRRSLSDYVSDKTDPKASVIAQIAFRAGVDAGWLVTGQGSPGRDAGAELEAKLVRMADAYDRQLPVTVLPGMVHLKEIGVTASAGLGASVGAESPVGVVAFDRAFLREQGAIPDRCTVIRARGDSMFPTIPDGSLLVVDHSQSQVHHGFITVIGLGEDLLVKRVRKRLDGTVELLSDNPAYAPEIIGPDRLDQLRIVGRVVYFCRAP